MYIGETITDKNNKEMEFLASPTYMSLRTDTACCNQLEQRLYIIYIENILFKNITTIEADLGDLNCAGVRALLPCQARWSPLISKPDSPEVAQRPTETFGVLASPVM